MLLVLLIIAITAGVAVPQLTAGLDAARTRAAARYLTTYLGMARTEAVTRGTSVAVRFQSTTTGMMMTLVTDGNGNGVRTQEIEAGVDREVGRAIALEHDFAGVTFGSPAAPNSSGIELGGGNLLSFSPSGTSSSGSLYLRGRDGSQFAVRVLGATGRVRIERFDRHSNSWLKVL